MVPSLAKLQKPASVISWTIDHSSRRGKKWMVKLVMRDSEGGPNGARHTVHFGDPSMEDFTQHHDEERRRRFHARFAKLIAKNASNVLSPMYYSANLLW